jgi:hypothetical protein
MIPSPKGRQAKLTEAAMRKAYEVQEANMNGQEMEITTNGISGRWANGKHSYQYPWTALDTLIDLPDGFLLKVSELSFVRIPKESLSLLEQDEIKQWAADNSVDYKAI